MKMKNIFWKQGPLLMSLPIRFKSAFAKRPLGQRA